MEVMLLRAYVTDEYWAEYAVLVIRDHDGEADHAGMELLAEFATDAQPGGTIAVAGAGWLWASASSGDGDNEVRLEIHDDVPADDLADWGDVVETPYLSFSGTVALSLLTGSGDVGRAIETPYGIAVLSDGGSVLVRPDGQAEVLATGTGNRPMVRVRVGPRRAR
jgi:hypothetical protein